MNAFLILADDLTGACDTGAAFAARGWRTVVLVDVPGALAGSSPALSRVDCLAVNLSTRSLSERAAQAVIASCLPRLAAALPGSLVYHKIDSTLRGNPSAELHTILDVLGHSRALVCPAFPQQGRTVEGGHLFVQGIPLVETVFAQGKAGSSLIERFKADRLVPLSVSSPDLSQAGVSAADARVDADLARLAQAGRAAGLPVWCGSAGLAKALAQAFGQAQPESAGEPASDLPPAHAPWLILAGSRHPVTVRQVERLRTAGACLFALVEEPALGSLASRMADCLNHGQTVVLFPHTLDHQPGEEQRIADRLAQAAALALANCSPLTLSLLLTGGDTAAALCKALGCTRLLLHGELQPGIAAGEMLDGQRKGTPVVTKAGGFGEEESLVRIVGAQDDGRGRRKTASVDDQPVC